MLSVRRLVRRIHPQKGVHPCLAVSRIISKFDDGIGYRSRGPVSLLARRKRAACRAESKQTKRPRLTIVRSITDPEVRHAIFLYFQFQCDHCINAISPLRVRARTTTYTAAQQDFSPGPKGPLIPGCEPGLRFRD
jgi:hypothetical protein